ncbi:glycosyltransferase family protein [Cyclobacterium amurskyense]|uniref:Glycosyl transferase group 1 n=1 Tax=Cyclobacterium amurskyense TaxID=320787 RepID=A0A0H4PDB7_9BACT|nr:hypothetical protein [Cyclobacterium amurskyense]AKP52436.1 hypothetical protein CA2015_3034 [Cyclobacterium amurskyense]
MKTLFIAKTNLNNDGRILNELNILSNTFPNLSIDFILLPDKPLTIKLSPNIKVHEINLFIRHIKLFRIFTILEFTFRSLFLLFKLKPSIVHAQDSAVVLPVLVYRILKGNKFKLIYDDHEIPNENQNIESKIYLFFEKKLLRISDFVLFANKERMELIKNELNLKNKCSYFLNLPYFDTIKDGLEDPELNIKLSHLDTLILNDTKFIIHQGVIVKERGRKLLADFSRILPFDFKILLLGGNLSDFELFVKEYDLDPNNFEFIGSVNYLDLNKFWIRSIASIVLYLPTYINNRLCAPNRLYISIKMNLPVIVNKDNPVLSDFVNRYNCGFFIEDIESKADFENIIQLKNNDFRSFYNKLSTGQISNFINIYKS